jgi:NAD(P)-dependent dehydrogenase (short-subunit alcohol dehydrogenase family)
MKRCLVTGASRGLGLELTRQLLARGERVLAACRKPGQAHELTKLALAHPGRLAVLPLDLSKPHSIGALAHEAALVVDALDVLINNAGVLPAGERYGELEQKALLEAFTTNAAGPLLLTQALTALLERGQAPRVMNLSSILGSIGARDSFYTPSYAISKAALNMATRLLAHELGARGIHVFAAHPGWVRTDMGGSRAELDPAESVRGLLALLDRAEALAGGFHAWNGERLPW